MKVVHLALTPLAGAPIRLVRALRAHAGVDARLVNLNPAAYGARRFDEDVDFYAQPDVARALIDAADIVHLHHWIDLAHNPFGVDLRGRVAIRHLHSQPHWVAAHGGGSVAQVLADPLPQLVVAQFHERFYPRARPVPNLLDRAQIDAARAQPVRTDARLTLCYQPTFDSSALSARWDTKGRARDAGDAGAPAARPADRGRRRQRPAACRGAAPQSWRRHRPRRDGDRQLSLRRPRRPGVGAADAGLPGCTQCGHAGRAHRLGGTALDQLSSERCAHRAARTGRRRPSAR